MAKHLLDLHGVRVEEVMEILDRFLVQAEKAGAAQVRIMTGKGTGKVQAEVRRILKLAHYSCHFERQANGKENTGVLVVHLE